jgi:Ca-activated chloride channel family protein
MIHRWIWHFCFEGSNVKRICGLILFSAIIQTLLVRATGILASEPQPQLDSLSSDTIRVGTYLVTVPVCITDVSGEAIHGMNVGDFRIIEDGNPQTIVRIVEAYEVPLRLGLVFDLSGSLHSRFELEKQAAIRFLKEIWKDGDSVCLVAFSQQTQILLERSIFISEALQELSKLRPTESSTALFNSVILSARFLRQSATPETRQAMVVLTDGADNRSDHNLMDTIEEVQSSDTIFYAINPSAASVRLNEINIKGQENLASLAAATGGTAFVYGSPDDPDGIFRRIAAELRAQYLLAYYSSNPLLDGRFRQIKVSTPNRMDLRIRARQGYYAIPKKAR